MKRALRIVSLVVFLIVLMVGAATFFLTQPATTRRGINGRVAEIQIPLYVKLLGFFRRHVQYRHLARNLVDGLPDRRAKIEALFEWTRRNVRPIPAGFPIVDDHVWNIIVRGYGSNDQAADVCATLSFYAGIPAHFKFICARDTRDCLGMAFVRLSSGGFGVFGPRNGIALRHRDGRFASVGEVETDRTILSNAASGLSGTGLEKYFERLPRVSVDDISRTSLQKPLRRAFILLTGGL